MLNFQKTTFLKSAFQPADFPTEQQPEVVFAGRSNVGKSSTLNKLTGQSKLAKVSKTPGRTTSINFFSLADQGFLVDLPGYGYAKVSHSVKEHWGTFIKNYISKRAELRGVVLIMDCRHPFTDLDQVFLSICAESERPCHVVLNKADKLSNNEKNRIFQKILKPFLEQYDKLSWQFFSASTGKGLNELKTKVSEWASQK